jgi:hypothetical protein
VEDNEPPTLNLDARLTIRELVLYFGGTPGYSAIDQWVRRRLVTTTKDRRGRIRIRLGDALNAEAATNRQRRGRPRKNRAQEFAA